MSQRIPSGTQSIVRTVTLLKALSARSQIGWRLTDLAAHCQLTTSTTHRIMRCLTAMRLARQRPHDKHYVPGPSLYEFSLAVPLYFQFQAACEASVAKVAARTRWLAFLALRSGDETVCIDRQGSTSVNLMNDVGRRLPMAGSSLGVAMLLSLPRGEQQALLARNRRALRSNPAHLGRAYNEMWRRSREAGFGLNLGDIVQGGASMSVAIVDAAGAPIAALGAAGPLNEFTEARIASACALLKDEVAKIQRDQAALIAELGTG
jgi:DNA-binding IclR family transcriptional regulator